MNRPTHSPDWHRIGPTRPALRPGVTVARRRFRQRRAYVLNDAAANTYFRLDPVSYHLVGLLDGRRTVDQAWWLTTDCFGDSAPTQNEVLGLLGQMYQLNLLSAGGAADGEQLLARKRRRQRAKAKKQAASWLFVKIPLADPAPALDFLLPLVRWLIHPWALVAWTLLLVTGVTQIVLEWETFRAEAMQLLRVQNLLTLLGVFLVVKLVHEFGHGLLCRNFGGAVHEMGIMFLVFHPVPYCDATSSWGLSSRWQRAMVGMAGVIVELSFAAVGAWVWTKTQPGPIHDVAYNAIFVGIASLLFNANPLLRFDGYYILSDLLDIPNLYVRANNQVKYLIQRFAFGMHQLRPVTSSVQESLWLIVYWMSAWTYRMFVFTAIIWFVSGQLFGLGILLAAFAGFMWIGVPLTKFVQWVSSNPVLGKHRARAALVTSTCVAATLIGLGLIPVDEHARALAVIENPEFAQLVVQANGFVKTVVCEDGRPVGHGDAILVMSNPLLHMQRQELTAQKTELEIQLWDATADDSAKVRVIQERIAAIDQQIRRADQQLEALTLRSPKDGVLVAARLDDAVGRYLERGDVLGEVRVQGKLRATVVLDQTQNALIFEEGRLQSLSLRTMSRPDRLIMGTLERAVPSALNVLRHVALGSAGGGRVATELRDLTGRLASEGVFEAYIGLPDHVKVHPGQRAVVRFTLDKRPLLEQWRRRLLQTLAGR